MQEYTSALLQLHPVLSQSGIDTTKSSLPKNGQGRDKERERLLPHIPLLYRDEILTRLLIDLFMSKKGVTPCGKSSK